MAMRGPRLEFAVGAFLLLTLASLLVLAVASTNQRWGFGSSQYTLTARFSQIGQLRAQAPVKIGGVTIGKVSDISLDPTKFDSVVTLSLDNKYKDLPADTSAGIFTSGLLGESYIGLQPGGDPETPAGRRDRLHPAGGGSAAAGRQVHVQWWRWWQQCPGRHRWPGPGACPDRFSSTEPHQ